jgi:Domain of unknown function (DUF4386)/Pyridine nucleotide-disulphide oxidoreductase
MRGSLALFFLDLHTDGYAVGFAFFALNCVVMARLLIRSSHAPRALGVLLAVAGVGYVVNGLVVLMAPGYHAPARQILLVPALIAETWFCALLVWKGGGMWQPAAAFVFVGLDANTGLLRGSVDLDRYGFVRTDDTFAPSMPGLFAVGDVRVGSTKQLGAAVG